jgi:hypothetical protein
MEFALTCGSLGDLLALANLTYQLARAIGGVGKTAVDGESAREYQDLQRDLSAFGQILLQVCGK